MDKKNNEVQTMNFRKKLENKEIAFEMLKKLSYKDREEIIALFRKKGKK